MLIKNQRLLKSTNQPLQFHTWPVQKAWHPGEHQTKLIKASSSKKRSHRSWPMPKKGNLLPTMDKPNHHRWRLHLMPASLRCSKTCAPKTFDSSDCNSDKNPQWDPFSRLKTRANGVRHFPDNNLPKSFRFPNPSNDLFIYVPPHSGPWQSDVHLPANLPQPHPGSTGSTRLNAQ